MLLVSGLGHCDHRCWQTLLREMPIRLEWWWSMFWSLATSVGCRMVRSCWIKNSAPKCLPPKFISIFLLRCWPVFPGSFADLRSAFAGEGFHAVYLKTLMSCRKCVYLILRIDPAPCHKMSQRFFQIFNFLVGHLQRYSEYQMIRFQVPEIHRNPMAVSQRRCPRASCLGTAGVLLKGWYPLSISTYIY
jgi:hypothetical protein